MSTKQEQKILISRTSLNYVATMRALKNLTIEEWEQASRGDFGTRFIPKGAPTVEQTYAAAICSLAYYSELTFVSVISYGYPLIEELLTDINKSHPIVTGIRIINNTLYYSPRGTQSLIDGEDYFLPIALPRGVDDIADV